MESGRAKFDLGEIIRSFGQEYERRHPMRPEQRRALRAIASCRTAALGGHKLRCPNCSHEEISYNSCRNNNCPKCQNARRMKWVSARLGELLPVPYFHVVFTIPDFFNDLHHSRYRELHNALFAASSGSILRFFRERGGVPAITATAHSWGQTMAVHPHVHMLVSGGCLSSDGRRWTATGGNYLFNVGKLSAEFKRRFLKDIKKRIPELAIPESVGEREWVVFCKRPFAGAAAVVKYLGRYVNRSAISNSRIKDASGGKVTFEYKNYRRSDGRGAPETAETSLSADEFIRRFLCHVPPPNFRRIRFYGILAGRKAKEKLEKAKELTRDGRSAPKSEPPPPATAAEGNPGPIPCPVCGKDVLAVVERLLPNGPPPVAFRNEKPGGRHAA